MNRFAKFDDAELSELCISLDHRLAEAKNGNAYVWAAQVERLLEEADSEADARTYVRFPAER